MNIIHIYNCNYIHNMSIIAKNDRKNDGRVHLTVKYFMLWDIVDSCTEL